MPKVTVDPVCTVCTLRFGRWFDASYKQGSIVAGSLKRVCPAHYQCVGGGSEYTGVQPKSEGCCRRCAPSQLCTVATMVEREEDVLTWNMCPPGMLCDSDYIGDDPDRLVSKCPAGFMCEGNRQMDCDAARSIPVTAGYGDIHAGSYCPEGSAGLVFCPQGSYCNTTTNATPCPEGYFCPLKTEVPKLPCGGCAEGAKIRAISPALLWVAVWLAVTAAAGAVVWLVVAMRRDGATAMEMAQKGVCAVKRKSTTAKKTEGREEVRNHRKSVTVADNGPERDRLNAMLAHIAKAIATAHPMGADGKDFTDETVQDPAGLFSYLDFDGSSALDYTELEDVLACFVKGKETKEDRSIRAKYFVHRLNWRAGAALDSRTVAEEAFVRHFYISLLDTGSFVDALCCLDELFDQMDADHRGTVSGYELFERLGFILTDVQVHELNEKFSARMHCRVNALEIPKEEFVANFRNFMYEVLTIVDAPGIDVAFRDLSLRVNVAGQIIKVVNGATGRLVERTMVAIMGGSGSGKTSLLSALCGRAFYGEVTGDILINGKEVGLQDLMRQVGFVPQDDIVYAELTVRENFIFAGCFRLPAGTTAEDIEDRADSVIASLGLVRVRNRVVGNARLRGVSGGEKKRVNVGLELMADPRVLFLDEPTSGLDSASSSHVMASLKRLVQERGVTVATVIHQPRRTVFELFDNVVLLAAGGRMVYTGPPGEVREYFETSGYAYPPRMNVADWMLDISTGEAHPSSAPAAQDLIFLSFSASTDASETFYDASETYSTGPSSPRALALNTRRSIATAFATAQDLISLSLSASTDASNTHSLNMAGARPSTGPFSPNALALRGREKANQTNRARLVSRVIATVFAAAQDLISLPFSSSSNASEMHSLHMAGARPCTGPSSPNAIALSGREKAKQTNRARLVSEWENHFDLLTPKVKTRYLPPADLHDIPPIMAMPPFLHQVMYNIRRNFLVMWRNQKTKVLDFFVVVAAVAFVTLLDGTTKYAITEEGEKTLTVPLSVITDNVDDLPLAQMFAPFQAAAVEKIGNGMKIGIICAVLVTLNATKYISDKHLEFFREASSGYNVSAYYAALNITSSIELLVQMVVTGFAAAAISSTSSNYFACILNFVMLAWICASWGFLFSVVMPPKNLTVVTGFYVAFFGLLFGGGMPPVTYEEIYGSVPAAIFSGLFAPTRYFVETFAIADMRCLPEQTGFTMKADSTLPEKFHSFVSVHLGMRDVDVADRRCTGWYWGYLPAFLVGLTIRLVAGFLMQVLKRNRMNKPSVGKSFGKTSFLVYFIANVIVILLFLGLSIYTILAER